MKRRSAPIALTFLLLTTACSGLALDDVLDAIPRQTSGELDRETIVAGLKEALRVGSERTIDRTAILNGFLANELIRIVLPDDLDSMAKTLRRIGLDRQVDELEVQMNRAAEEAAGEALDVLAEEIRGLSFPDAMGILRGGDTAATDFFRERTSDEIRQRFQPIVVEKMDEVGLARLYGLLADQYNQIPFVSRPAVDLERYVTDEALDGLFTVLAEEETKIREDPVARTTELLKRVFGRAIA